MSSGKKMAAILSRLAGPVLACAPMVQQSDFAFRLLCARYGCNLVFTPMVHAAQFVANPSSYMQQGFETDPDRELVVMQFCATDPDVLKRAGQAAAGYSHAFDLNFGCPQGIARKGGYGAFLLNNLPLMQQLVTGLSEVSDVPVTCKIRVPPTVEETIEVAQGLAAAGCQMLTVHGRTKEQNKQFCGAANWNVIRECVEHVQIPVIANGNISSLVDARECIKRTGAAGVMSAEGLLENPALFYSQAEKEWCSVADRQTDLAFKYLDLVEASEYQTQRSIRPHLFKMFHQYLYKHVDIRDALVKCRNIDEARTLCQELRVRLLPVDGTDRCDSIDSPSESDARPALASIDTEGRGGWYLRHRGTHIQHNALYSSSS